MVYFVFAGRQLDSTFLVDGRSYIAHQSTVFLEFVASGSN